MRQVGLDGCRAGWIAVTRTDGQLDYALFGTIREVAGSYAPAARIFADVPIGLPWKGLPIRPCDQLARAVLGRPRNSSVFPVPCREAAYASSLSAAQEINTAVLGRRLTRQTWGICPKIAEVDSLLATNLSATTLLREVHPEVCFWALAGGQPMRYRKSTAAGQKERRDLLDHHEPSSTAFVQRVLSQTRRRDVHPDDVLDALVALITAETPETRLKRLAGEPHRDERGLPMEMLYAAAAEASPNFPVQRTAARVARAGR